MKLQRGDWKTLGCGYQFFVIVVGACLLLVVGFVLLEVASRVT